VSPRTLSARYENNFQSFGSDVADITKAPEMLGGRVKTLHPVVHGGARSVHLAVF
jgi:AICAR transformylase/IMP cyclohydrolase PurH